MSILPRISQNIINFSHIQCRKVAVFIKSIYQHVLPILLFFNRYAILTKNAIFGIIVNDVVQLKIFDLNNQNNNSGQKKQSDLSDCGLVACPVSNRFLYYEKKDYINDVARLGLKQTWDEIIYYTLNNTNLNPNLSIDKFSELYEAGLAVQDKNSKKRQGQYYTPNDVANLMARWLFQNKGSAVCDVACGTGQLILAYLEILSDEAVKLLQSGNVYLYDNDPIALNICKTILIVKYGYESVSHVHFVCADFLSKDICLPDNCKVICNPPYSQASKIEECWDKTNTAVSTKSLYAMFMEKIIKQSASSVIITPYSFVGAEKFYSLRLVLNNYNGYIISFDNVPGNVFNGKKQGVFNSNTTNSVRAAITVVQNKENVRGFRISPVIRFKNTERERLLEPTVLESFLNEEGQIVSGSNMRFYKCHKELYPIWQKWISTCNETLGDYVVKDGPYVLSIPTTCRYFTVAANGTMNRSGKIELRFENEHAFHYAFCLINSSFAYWYWRVYDGGITFSKNLLLSIPFFFNLLTDEQIGFFDNMALDMISTANQYIVTKNNKGTQENIKYPLRYKEMINRKLLDVLGINTSERVFDCIHANTAF